jgi:peptidoglycan/LPS O-acetylase OafA/YrhL
MFHIASQAEAENPARIVSGEQRPLTSRSQRFYRPELDVLRFVAFLAVFLCHGPRLPAGPFAPHWEKAVAFWFDIYAHSGAFGVCLFFLLSAYLITELLLQEREKTGTVHLQAFYVRRILRIWPLYYLGVLIAIAVGFRMASVRLNHSEILYLVFFVGWLGGLYHFNPMGPLWSISVEEVFYAVWPTIAKLRGKASILVACIVIIPISLVSSVTLGNWYDPAAQFLFFACGGFLAIGLHRSNFKLTDWSRLPAALIAFLSWGLVIYSWQLGASKAVIVGDQLLLAFSCVLLFLAFYGLETSALPRPLIYLGRISYGLYVFHLLCLTAVRKIVIPRISFEPAIVRLLIEDAIALTVTVILAALSYRYFESPFLRLKQRFTFVRARD